MNINMMQSEALNSKCPKPLLVPSSYRNIFRFNQLSSKDIKNPHILKRYFSLHDLQAWMDLQGLYTKLTGSSPLQLETFNLVDLFTRVNDPELKDYAQQFLSPNLDRVDLDAYRSDDTNIIDLASPNAQLKDYFYEIQLIDDELFLIYLEPSFLHALEFRDKALKFISDCLKIYYSYLPLNAVSEKYLFRRYLQVMNPRVPFVSNLFLNPAFKNG